MVDWKATPATRTEVEAFLTEEWSSHLYFILKEGQVDTKKEFLPCHLEDVGTSVGVVLRTDTKLNKSLPLETRIVVIPLKTRNLAEDVQSQGLGFIKRLRDLLHSEVLPVYTQVRCL